MKKCIQCNKEFEPKRSDAKFCCSTCKAKHWENNKLELPQAQNNKLSNNLRGVISSEPTNTEPTVNETKNVATQNPTKLIKVETKEYKDYKEETNMLHTSKKRLENEIYQLNSYLQKLENKNGVILTLLTTVSSAGVAYDKYNNGWAAILGGGLGYGAGEIINSVRKKGNEPYRQNEIIWSKQKLSELNVSLTSINKQITENSLKLFTLKFYEYISVQDIPTLIPCAEIESPNQVEIIPQLSVITNPTEVKIIKESIPVKKAEAIRSDKILCSLDLQKFKYDALNFQGKWLDFFGLPSTNFHLVLHGMSGEGKSTFAIQFAKYLAQNFGRVLYISGEEGFAKTFNDKLTNNDAACPDLFVADLHSFEEILKDVPADTFNFKFFDSVDDMSIDAKKLKELRKLYKDSALITISQSTKDGKMRGSNQIKHDSDMAVQVDNGIATTTKNRFKQKGMILKVF